MKKLGKFRSSIIAVLAGKHCVVINAKLEGKLHVKNSQKLFLHNTEFETILLDEVKRG